MGLRSCLVFFTLLVTPGILHAEQHFIPLEKTASPWNKEIVLPNGFNYRVIDNTKKTLPIRPDMNVLSADGKFIFTTHEIFDKDLSSKTASLTKTDITTGKTIALITGLHAADGLKKTPWNTLLLGEEHKHGHIHEVNPDTGEYKTRNLLGRFSHEGIAVAGNGIVYMTDDNKEGAIYKFVPSKPLTENSLTDGKLFALSIAKGWLEIESPETARQESIQKGATLFNRPEDIEIGPDGHVYAAITAEHRVVAISDSGVTPVVSDYITKDTGIIYPDNLVFHPDGSLYVLQDIPAHLQYLNVTANCVWRVTPDHEAGLFACWPGIHTEPSGAVFSSNGKLLYINVLEHSSEYEGAILEINGF